MGDLNNPNENNSDQTNNQSEGQDQNQQSIYQQTQYQQPQNQQPQNQQSQYQQQYQQYQEPQQQKKNNGMAIASMVCGIVGFVFSCCLWYLALPLSIVGIVLGIISIKNKKDGKGMAIVGIVLSSITLIIAILAVIGFATLAGNPEFLNEIYSELGLEQYQ